MEPRENSINVNVILNVPSKYEEIIQWISNYLSQTRIQFENNPLRQPYSTCDNFCFEHGMYHEKFNFEFVSYNIDFSTICAAKRFFKKLDKLGEKIYGEEEWPYILTQTLKERNK